MNKFLDIEYLNFGNKTQKQLYQCLKNKGILDILSPFGPLVVGTIPIGINIPGSDVDIICNIKNIDGFESYIRENFSEEDDFFFKRNEHLCLAGFKYSGFEFEIYGEPKPTKEQNAYIHMLVEYRILAIAGENFRQQVIKLKSSGHKTEPAFGILLKLENPYEDLIQINELTDTELSDFIKNYYDTHLI